MTEDSNHKKYKLEDTAAISSKYRKKKKCQLRILYSEKISLEKAHKINTLTDIQKM